MIRFSVWLVSCHSHVFVRLSVVIVTLTVHIFCEEYKCYAHLTLFRRNGRVSSNQLRKDAT